MPSFNFGRTTSGAEREPLQFVDARKADEAADEAPVDADVAVGGAIDGAAGEENQYANDRQLYEAALEGVLLFVLLLPSARFPIASRTCKSRSSTAAGWELIASRTSWPAFQHSIAPD